MKYLAVKNFRSFQHYTDRKPPWIKLYFSLLGDFQFVALSEAQQIHLVLIWLIASRHENRIPYDQAYIRAAIRAKRKVDIEALIRSGFLVVVDADYVEPPDSIENASAGASTDDSAHASTAASNGASTDASAGASPPYAREEEAEGTRTTASNISSGDFDETDALARRLTSALDRKALSALIARVPHIVTWRAEMIASLDGMAGHAKLTPAQLGKALREFVGNGKSLNPSFRQFRRYLEQAATDVESTPKARTNGATSPARNGARTAKPTTPQQFDYAPATDAKGNTEWLK